jgi:hypothetical protein
MRKKMAVRIRTEKENSPPALLRFIKYLIITLVVVSFCYYTSKTVFDGKFILYVLSPTIGAFIGDTIRRYCKPDVVYMKNELGTIFKTKLYWKYGPQWSGWLFGLIALAIIFDQIDKANKI